MMRGKRHVFGGVQQTVMSTGIGDLQEIQIGFLVVTTV